MSTTEKVLLALTVIFSWILGFFVKYIFDNDFAWGASVWYISLCVALWLIPISFLVLFTQKKCVSFGAFILGILSFLVIEQNVYIFLGLLFLALAFGYWFSYARHAQKNAIAFSIFHLLNGIGFFFTVLAIFGGLLSFYSPFANQVLHDPKIPEGILDTVYEPISSMVIGQQVQNNDIDLPTPEQLKSEFYKSINGTVARLATQYQRYIPFAFALNTFLFLKTIFVFLKYLLPGCMFVLINLFIKLGWLKKEKQQVEVELIKI